MENIQTRDIVASQYILQFENILDDLQNNVTDILQNNCNTIETDHFSKDVHALFDPLRSNLKKCFLSCSNISKLQSKLEEIYQTVNQYIEINKNNNSNLLTSNEYLVILETIAKTQRKIIVDLLVPDEDILSISYNNITQRNMPSPTASYSRRKDSVCSCSSPIHSDEVIIDTYLNETTKSLLETVKNKLISYQCEFENNLVERFVEDSREKDQQIQMLEMELESSKQNSNFDEIRKEYEPIIDELENQIKQLKNDNKDLRLDYEFVLSNISSLTNIESNNENNNLYDDNDENGMGSGVFTDGITPSSCYIDNLEMIQKDLMTMNKDLKDIIERKNLYINSLDLEKIEKYNENIKAVEEIIKQSKDNPNKILAKQFQQISLLIKNIGDISQDYQNMKNQIKDEMRLEMKESYRAIEQEHTFKYNKLLQKYQKEVEEHSLEKAKYEKIKVDTNLLTSWYKEELKQYLESYPMEDDNDNIDTEDGNTIDGPKRYKDLLYEYHLQHHQSTLKDVTIQYLRSIIDKEKKKRVISNQRFVDMIKDFDNLKKQYLKLLISDNTKISEINSLRSTLKHSYLERKETDNDNNENGGLNDIPVKELINPFQFDTSIDLIVDKIDETINDINEICNLDDVPKTGKETVYNKWSKKITELEDIIEQKDDSLNDKEFSLKQNNKIIELESKIREKDNQINDFVVQLNEIQNSAMIMDDDEDNNNYDSNDNSNNDVSTNSKKFKNLLKEKDKKIDELNQTLEDLTTENENMKYLLDGSSSSMARESTIGQLSLLPTNIKLTMNEYSDLNILETSIEDVEDVCDTAEYQALLHDFDLLTEEYNKLKARKGNNNENNNGDNDDEIDNLESRKLDEALVENEELKLELQNADELNADLQAEISSLKYKLENKEDNNLNDEFDKDEMKMEIENYKSQIKMLEEQHQNDADNYENELLSKDEENMKLRDEYERLQKEMELLKNANEISKEGIDENTKEIQNLSLQLDEKEEVIINYEEEIDKLKNRVSKLENDLQNKKNETSILEDNLADACSLQSAYDLLLLEKSVLEEENQKLKKQLEDLNEHIQNNNDNFLADLRSQYESRLQELQDQVNRITLSPIPDDNIEDINNNNNNNGSDSDLRRSKKIGIEDLQKQNDLVWNENRNLRDKLRQIETKLLILETSKQVEIEEKDQLINSLNEQLKKSNEGNINAMKKRYENRIIELTNELNELKALQTIKEETNEQNYSSIVFDKNAQIMNLKMENSELRNEIESIKEDYHNKIHELETKNILLQDSMETLTKTNSILKEKINEQLNLISQNQSTDYELQMLRAEKEKNMEIISQLQKTIETIELLKNQPELLAKYIDQTDRIKDLTSLLDEQTKRYVIEISEMSNYVNELKSDKSLLQLDYETLYSQYLNEKKKNDEENSDKISHLKELEDEIKRITKDNDYETCEFLQSYAKKLIKTVESDMEVETHLYKDYISQNLSQIITLLQALYDQLVKKEGKIPKSRELRNKLEDIRILIEQYPDAMTSALQISKKDRRDIKILKRNGKHFEEWYKKVKNEKMKQEKKFNEERRKWRYDYYRKLRIIQEECDQKVASLCSRLRKIEEKHNKEVKELGKNYWDKFLKAEKANRNRLLSLRSNETSYQYNGKDYGRARRQSTLLLKALAPLPEENDEEEKKKKKKSNNSNNNKAKNLTKKVSNDIKATKLIKPSQNKVKPITKSAPLPNKRKVKEDNKKPINKTQVMNKTNLYESKLRKPTVKAVALSTIAFGKKSNNKKATTKKVEDNVAKKVIRSTVPSHIIAKSKKPLKIKVSEDNPTHNTKSKIPRSPKMKRINDNSHEEQHEEEEEEHEKEHEKENNKNIEEEEEGEEEIIHTMIPKPGTIRFNKEDNNNNKNNNNNNMIKSTRSLSNSRRISKIKPPTELKLTSSSSNDDNNNVNNQMSSSMDGRRMSKIKPPTDLKLSTSSLSSVNNNNNYHHNNNSDNKKINNQMSCSMDGRRVSKIKPPTNLSSSYREKNNKNLKQFSNKDLPPPKPMNRNKQISDLTKSSVETDYNTPEKRNRVNSIEPLLDNTDSEPSILTNFLKPPSEYADIISKRKSTKKDSEL